MYSCLRKNGSTGKSRYERYRVKIGGVGLTARNDVAWSESPLIFGYIRLRFHGIVVRANLKCVRDNRVMGYRHCLYVVN